MATTRPSFTKRQRETAKRERQQMKAAKRAARKAAGDSDIDIDIDNPPTDDIEIADVESQTPPAEQ